MFKKSIVSILIVFFGQVSFAQNMQYIDSLKSQLPYISIKNQADHLAEIGFAYRLSHPDSTIIYCKKAYKLGLENGLQDGLSKVLSYLGLAYAYSGEYSESFDYHRLAIENAEASKDSIQLAYGYNNLGRLFFDQGDLNRSYQYLMNALRLMEILDDQVGLSYVYRSLANLYKSQRDNEKALEASHKALNYRIKSGNQRAILSAMFELGLIYQKTDSHTKAIEILLDADSIAKKINDPTSQAEINMALAEIHLDNNDVGSAVNYVNLADEHIATLTNSKFNAMIDLLKARQLVAEKKYQAASQILAQFVKSEEAANNLSMLRDAYSYYAQAQKGLGNLAEGINLENKYLIINEKLHNLELAREIERLEFQITIEQKERENEILKATQASIAKQLVAERQLKITFFVVLMLSIMLIGVILRNNNKKQLANKRLSTQRDQIDEQKQEIERKNQLISAQNDELKEQNKKLSDLNTEKDTLMNIVAHDLKSPFHRIKGLLEILRIGEEATSEQRQIFDMLANVVRNGEELISDILDVNNLESDRTQIKPQFITLSSFVQEQMHKHKQMADIKKIDLKYKSTSPIFTLFTDPGLLGRIMENLLSNAIKFSPKGSEVEVWLAKDKDLVEIHVKDSGPGFTEKDQSLVFQKFKKLSAQPTGGESSHGLGLAIVKILTERLNGTVELKTKEGKGSHFILTFKA